MLYAFLIGAMLSQPASPPVKPAGPAEYEVCYHHVVRNKTDHELKDVKVYLPVPQSDGYQQVEEFRIQSHGRVRDEDEAG